MSQWSKIHWKEEDLKYLGEVIIHPHVDDAGVKTCKSSHPQVHPFHEMDWGPEHETNKGMAHLHDGVVDHIKLHPRARPQGISLHARWHDKDGNIVRQDAHFQCK